MVRIISNGFDLDKKGFVSNIKIYRLVSFPKNSLIDLVNINNNINLIQNWKIIQKLMSLEPVHYKP